MFSDKETLRYNNNIMLEDRFEEVEMDKLVPVNVEWCRIGETNSNKFASIDSEYDRWHCPDFLITTPKGHKIFIEYKTIEARYKDFENVTITEAERAYFSKLVSDPKNTIFIYLDLGHGRSSVYNFTKCAKINHNAFILVKPFNDGVIMSRQIFESHLKFLMANR